MAPSSHLTLTGASITSIRLHPVSSCERLPLGGDWRRAGRSERSGPGGGCIRPRGSGLEEATALAGGTKAWLMSSQVERGSLVNLVPASDVLVVD
ncbi:hypothetical protein EYF80_068328 [Liparis tanakae]|uniref:Uncharacterized protein n=1 Tax=Liparis tanakae TaxID=230148 RepID=A0A4Z2DZ90_9TELE|nr:hypothetical protein EYF80_068328 [Liparis tanakae]